jgi:hypothetical protein
MLDPSAGTDLHLVDYILHARLLDLPVGADVHVVDNVVDARILDLPVGTDFHVIDDVLDVRLLDVAADVTVSALLQTLFRQCLEGDVASEQDGLSACRTVFQSRSASRTDIVTVSTQADWRCHAFETYWALQNVG